MKKFIFKIYIQNHITIRRTNPKSGLGHYKESYKPRASCGSMQGKETQNQNTSFNNKHKNKAISRF